MTFTAEGRVAPIDDEIDPAELMRDPYPAYARWREMGPVVHVPRIHRYLVTTPTGIRTAEQDPATFTAHQEVSTMVRALGGRPMLRKDDPAHEPERTAINPTLRPRQVANDWSPRFEQTVEEWLDRLGDRAADDVDINRDFAAPVASQNLIDLVGFRDVDVRDMHRWSTDFIAGIGNILDDPAIWSRCERSVAEVHEHLDELLPHLERNPDRSIASHLQQAGLSEEQVRNNVMLTISGGMNEPQHMITNMVWALDRHRDQLAGLVADPEGWGNAFEEVVRWISPIGMVPRETTVDTVLEGTAIPAGHSVGLLVACANRHPDSIDRPDELDVTRGSRAHLGFGAGVHQCAGRWAAKTAVGEVAVPRLFERYPNLRADAERPATWDGWVFRGITSIPVLLD